MQRTSFLIVALLFLFSCGAPIYAQESNELAKIEAGIHFTSLTIGPQDTPLGFSFENTKALSGFGGRFTYNLNRHVALEAEGNFFPAVFTSADGQRWPARARTVWRKGR